MFQDMRVVQIAVMICLYSTVLPHDAGAADPVQFDVPAAIVGQELAATDPALVRHADRKLVRLRVPVSTFLDSEFTGSVHEYFVEIVSPHRSMQVIDLWPRNELVSTIEGNVAVEMSRQGEQSIGVNLLSTSTAQVRNGVNGSLGAKQSVEQRFEQKPPVHLLTASGTTHRGSGAFFKFRAGPIGLADGMRDVALLVEVPLQWRADLLEIRMRAVGTRSRDSREVRQLGASHAWIAVYRDGDLEAAALADQFVSLEQKLRIVMEAQRKRLDDRSLPTVFHRLGAALDLVEPKIPDDLLVQALFGKRDAYTESVMSRLPVDVRVAILEFQDARDAMQEMAFNGQLTSSLGMLPQQASRTMF